jgi:hypothetical protein
LLPFFHLALPAVAEGLAGLSAKVYIAAQHERFRAKAG